MMTEECPHCEAYLFKEVAVLEMRSRPKGQILERKGFDTSFAFTKIAHHSFLWSDVLDLAKEIKRSQTTGRSSKQKR